MKKFSGKLSRGTFRAGVAILSRIPYRAALGLGSFAGRCVFYLSNRKRVAYADLKAVFGNRFSEKERWRIVRDHYKHLGRTAAEMIRFPRLDRQFLERLVQIHDIERFYGAMDVQKGVILLTAHFGNWELLQIISSILGKPVHVLARNKSRTPIPRLSSTEPWLSRKSLSILLTKLSF